MDIKNLYPNALRPETTTSGGKTRAGIKDTAHSPDATAISSSSGESLTLTQAAKTLTAAMEGAATAPYDSDKVERIRTAIAEGRYAIDDRRVAENMLNFESLLI